LQIEDQKEYEKVFYDGLSFREIMAANKVPRNKFWMVAFEFIFKRLPKYLFQAKKEQEAEEVVRKEKEFTENYVSAVNIQILKFKKQCFKSLVSFRWLWEKNFFNGSQELKQKTSWLKSNGQRGKTFLQL